ncbi:MAG: GDSL-type esterase/lipase family protein [Evtepia sp.]|uniref:GDSL-type esterase/lipase family protein n=1 Tax=Evtepia sp. TaxID=2773933 RepID=UPI002A751A0A|nr:GDSL-type esterase/lipase family protein [Evtepia sp.]MDY3014985.1 GDSL-type esterase/lipase family protein [Evtepia sp.]
MKRWITLSLALVFILSLCACGQPAEAEGGGEQPGTATEPAGGQSQEGDSPEEEKPAFVPLVPASETVDPSWFNDAAFVGDSVSVMLESYNSSSNQLGEADFFCSVSLSQTNALSYQAGNSRLPEYPKGSGQRPKLEDGIAASGAKKVYIMLGMNCIAGGVDRACKDLVTLVDRILEKSPGATILIQSVTPMTADSPRADDSLNNTTIGAFNTRMQEICQERQWYFVDVSEAVKDEAGYLRADFSGDKAMGIHFNYNGAAAWAEYLLTHVPEALK